MLLRAEGRDQAGVTDLDQTELSPGSSIPIPLHRGEGREFGQMKNCLNAKAGADREGWVAAAVTAGPALRW